jgi:hypothetical protein
MTRRITHLIEEHKNKSKIFNTRDQDVKVARILEDTQNIEVPISDKERILPLKESQQSEVTMSKENKNQNGKRNTEMKLTGKKARNLSKKRYKMTSCRRFQREPHRRKICKIGASSGYQNSDTWHFTMVKQYSHWGHYNH